MIVTSVDGQWAAIQRGRGITLLERGAGPPVGMMEAGDDDVDLALVGPPDVLAVVTRGATPRVTLHQPPYLDTVARLDLDEPMRLAAVTGPRFALVSAGGKQVVIVRVAGRALSSQTIDTGSPAEFVVGLERNQFLLGLLRKLEVWDAVSGRPLLRLQLQLPPPPRTVGAAQGHLWATRPGTDEVFVYRLSDGRLFQHFAGSPVESVICHPASPLIVLVTRAGLVRLHCFAHSLAPLDVPWAAGTSLALLVAGDDIALLGLDPSAAEPWRAPIAGAGAPAFGADAADAGAAGPGAGAAAAAAVGVGAAAAAAAAGAGAAAAAAAAAIGLEPAPAAAPARPDSLSLPPTSMLMTLPARAEPPRPSPVTPVAVRPRAWREPLVPVGAELARGADAELPVLPVDNELGELAHRLQLSATARRTLIALYALYLTGAPRVAIARLATITADWGEPLGQGELGGARDAAAARRPGLAAPPRGRPARRRGAARGAARPGGAPGRGGRCGPVRRVPRRARRQERRGDRGRARGPARPDRRHRGRPRPRPPRGAPPRRHRRLVPAAGAPGRGRGRATPASSSCSTAARRRGWRTCRRSRRRGVTRSDRVTAASPTRSSSTRARPRPSRRSPPRAIGTSRAARDRTCPCR